MKKIVITLFVYLLINQPVSLQGAIFNGRFKFGGYGGPFFKVGQINSQTGFFGGGQGGLILNHSYVVGLKGYGLSNNIEIDGVDNRRLTFHCGGFFLEYIVPSDKAYLYSFEAMIGSGNLGYDSNLNDQDDDPFPSDSFFVIEPGVNAIIKISKNFRIGAGVTYRYVNGVDYESLSDSDIMGISAQLVLKFGGF